MTKTRMFSLVTLAATVVVAVSLFVRSSEAPAHVPAGMRLSAPAASLAVLDGDTLRLGDQVVRLARWFDAATYPLPAPLTLAEALGRLDEMFDPAVVAAFREVQPLIQPVGLE